MKKALLILGIALIARILFGAIMFSNEDLAYLREGDSHAYLALSENLYEHGVYASTEELIPDNHRPPLYPLFLIPFTASNAPFEFIALAQSILVSLAAVLMYLISRRVFSERIAFFASLLFALEPTSLLFSAMIFSEPLFIAFFTPSLLLLGLAIATRDPRLLVFASALLALSALTRAISLPLAVLVPLAAALGWGWRVPWKHLALSGTIFVLIISPWLWFNVQTFGALEFSSTGSRNLYQDNAAQFERWLFPDKEPFFTRENRATIVGKDRVRTVEGAHELGAIAQDFIFTHPVEYGIFHIIYMPRLFVHAGYNDVYLRLTGTPLSIGPSIYDTLVSLRVADAIDLITSRSPILLLSKGFFIVISILALLHPLLAWKFERRLLAVSIFFTLFTLFYAFLVSPVGQARLRFPIHPILFLLALDSVRLLLSEMRTRSLVARS